MSQILGLSSKYLRKLLQEGQLPGVYCGTRYMVNYPATVKMLSEKYNAPAKKAAAVPEERTRPFDKSEKIMTIPYSQVESDQVRSRAR